MDRPTVRSLDAGKPGDRPAVFCILLNWNGCADTLECLDSLGRTRYSNLTVIVVDNGSTDGSVAQIRKAYPDIELIQSPTNLGYGAGNNLGIRHALRRGAKYIWLLNNDTVVEPDTLSALVALCEADPMLGQAGSVLSYAHAPSQVQAWGGGQVNLWMGTSRHSTQPLPTEQLDFLTAASVLIRASVLEEVGLFDEAYFMYWEDTDLSFRIRRAGWKLGVAENARLLHKEGASSKTKSPQHDRYVTSSGRRFLKEYAPLPFVSLAIFIYGRAIRRLLRGNLDGFLAILRA